MTDQQHGDDGHSHEHGHSPEHGHSHGNEHDRGLKAMVRYARHAHRLWRSEVNDAVIDLVGPSPGETVVDIGAGVGAGTVVAARRGATVVAVEPTPYMRRILGLRRLAQKARSSIRIVDGAAEATGVGAGSADAVWAVNTMHHWTNLEAGVAELARVVADGGRVVLVDEAFDDPAHPDYERFQERHNDSDGHGHMFEMVDAEVVADLLAAAGLTITSAGSEQVRGRPAAVVKASKPVRSGS